MRKLFLFIFALSCICLQMQAQSNWMLYVWSDAAYAADANYQGETHPLQSTSAEGIFTIEGLNVSEFNLKYCVTDVDWTTIYGWSEEASGIVVDPGQEVVMGITNQASGWLNIHPGSYDVTFDEVRKTIRFDVHAPEGYKRVSVLGDSYSTMYGWITPSTNETFFPRFDVQNVEQTWWYQVISSGHYVLERNNVYSGSTMTNNTLTDWKDTSKKIDVSTSFISRATNLGDPDMILICGGTNDEWNNDNSMGDYKYSDWSDDDLKLFRPGTAYLMNLVKTTYPKAQIIFVLNDILPRVSDSIKTICAHYGIPVAAPQGIMKDETGHPSPEGMTTIANEVVRTIHGTTGIRQTIRPNLNLQCYDLLGRPTHPKGLYILNGRKIISHK